MGGAFSNLVAKALSPYVDVEEGKFQPGFSESSYSGDKLTIKPQSLGKGLVLEGDVAHLRVSTKTLKALGSLIGKSPPIKLSAQGLKLRIADGSFNEAQPHRARAPQRNSDRSASFRPVKDHIDNLEVDLRDISVELCVAGHTLTFVAAHLALLPQGGGAHGPKTLRPHLRHEGVHVKLDGKEIATLRNGTHRSCFNLEARCATISVSSEVKAAVDVGQLAAIADMALALDALAAAGEHQEAALAALELTCCNLCAQLNMFDDLLLSLECRAAHASLKGQSYSIKFDAFQVRTGDGNCASSDVVLRNTGDPKMTMEHDFPNESGPAFPPWRSTVDLLLADPRFQTHQAWLKAICDDFESKSGTNGRQKRTREEQDDAPEQRAIRPRLG